MILQPNRSSYRESQWLVIFCDEINLPVADKYGTQTVIMFMRQLIERGGYWNVDCKWISLRRIQFVGACNPPTDAGRVSLSERFLRHAPLLLVDYPTEASLSQIYRCFNHALLKLHPNLRGAVDALNDAMIEFYLRNQEKFLPDVAPQYIYSPRELSRFVIVVVVVVVVVAVVVVAVILSCLFLQMGEGSLRGNGTHGGDDDGRVGSFMGPRSFAVVSRPTDS